MGKVYLLLFKKITEDLVKQIRKTTFGKAQNG